MNSEQIQPHLSWGWGTVLENSCLEQVHTIREVCTGRKSHLVGDNEHACGGIPWGSHSFIPDGLVRA